ncbi:MAG: GNAT family N-acetyltransferase [Candidatus Woesearchaeota archaeon]
MEIREPKIEDAKKISDLLCNTIKHVNSKDINKEQLESWLKRNSLEEIQRKITQEARSTFVLIDNNQIVGYLAMFLESKSLSSMYIKHDVISKGYGKKLLEFAEEFAKKNGVDELNLESSTFAFDFYKSKGYIPIKESFHDVNGTKIPVIVMRKKL